jgi:hypothetical protein
MKQLYLSLTVLVSTLMAFMPAAVRADEGLDDLDATMTVLDDVSELGETIAEMDGPDDDDVEDVDWEYEYEEDVDHDRDDSEAEDESAEELEDEFEDGFEGDVEKKMTSKTGTTWTTTHSMTKAPLTTAEPHRLPKIKKFARSRSTRGDFLAPRHGFTNILADMLCT